MSEQWYNCILQRKIDGKEIKAYRTDGKYYDITGVQLIGSSYRVVELEEDYEDDDSLIPVFDEDDDVGFLGIVLIVVIIICIVFSVIY